MPYSSPTQINRQRALSQQLRAQPYNRASTTSGLAHVLRQFGAGRGEYLAGQRETENTELKQREMQNLITALQGGGNVDPGQFTHPDVQALYANSQLANALAQTRAGSTGSHKDISRHQYYQGLEPEDQKTFLEVQRATPEEFGQRRQKVQDVNLATQPEIDRRSEEATQAAQLAAIPEKGAQEIKIAAEKETQVQFSRSKEKFLSGQSKVLASLDSARNKRDLIIKTADEAKALINGMSTSYGAVMKNWPATEARRLMNKLETLKGNVAFGVLEDMRSNSPTGGAVGQLSDPEREALAATLGSFDQYNTPQDLLVTIDNVVANRNALVTRMEDAYGRDAERYGVQLEAQEDSIDDLLKQYGNP